MNERDERSEMDVERGDAIIWNIKKSIFKWECLGSGMEIMFVPIFYDTNYSILKQKILIYLYLKLDENS